MADVMKDAVDGLYGLFNDDESFGNVYDRHNKADLDLPAISVGPGTATPNPDDGARYTSQDIVYWDLTTTIRVHTAYTGGVLDQSGTINLVDDVLQKLRDNISAIANYKITGQSVAYDLGFEESETRGAQIEVMMLTYVQYTQE